MAADLTRRTVLKTAAIAGGTALTMPFVRGAYAAGKLSCGFWDHWVPGANDPMRKLCQEWADKEQGRSEDRFRHLATATRLLLTIAAEAQASSGHDMLSIPTWYAAAQADNLEPVDDVMQQLIEAQRQGQRPPPNISASRTATGSRCRESGATLTFPCVGRIDLFKEHAGLDVMKMYPASGHRTRNSPTTGPGTRS